MENEIKVSIVCNAYNHGKYIKKALDGFLMQKTSFKYEVLIHDDASTDGTAGIIREYQQKYPDIIKPIFQKENQYSQKIRISYRYQFPRADGKYIAICEGDDFWTDENKLQKQFDIMEQHEEVDMCAHAAQCIDAETGEPLTGIDIIDSDDVIKELNYKCSELYSSCYEFDDENGPCRFNDERAKEIKDTLIDLLKELKKRLNLINDGTFVIDDKATDEIMKY